MNSWFRIFPKMFPLVLCAASILAFSARAQDPAAIWEQLTQPTADPGKAARVSNLTIERDRVRITLEEGTLQFMNPVVSPAFPQGLVYGAAFRGSGRIEVQPPNPIEAQQLLLLARQETLAMTFREATLTFSDETFAELSSKLEWSGAAGPELGELFRKRQDQHEDVGAELVPRLFKSVLSDNRTRTALFVADLNTRESGWIHASVDALDPEEVSVGRWADWGGARFVDLWMSFPTGGRSSSAAYADPLARDDFRIRGYRIDATVTGGAELNATTTVNLETRLAGEHVLLFELDSNLRVESVKDSQGTALTFFQPRDPKNRDYSYGDYVAVVLPAPTEAGQPLSFQFVYGGKRVIRKEGQGVFFCQSYGWYPSRSHSFANRADFEITFRSPKKYLLVATGAKQEETVDGDWRITSWKGEIPLAVAGFSFGDYKLHTEKVGDIEVDVYANREPDDFMRSIRDFVDELGPDTLGANVGPVGTLSPSHMAKNVAIEMGNTLRVFQAYYGPYPYKRLAIVNIPYFYGQGWPALIYLSALSFLDSTQRNSLGIRDHVELTDFFRAHESSHQWWGHEVGWKSYHDQWLSEGFAQFSGNLYVNYRENEKAYLTRIRKDKEELLTRDKKNRVYESLGPVWMGSRLSTTEAPGAYSVVVYNKGGLILHMIRRMLWDTKSKAPDDRFVAMMKEFCETYYNRPASTEDFKAVLEKHMTPNMDLEGNQRMDWFFRQYVYGTGVPKYAVRQKVQDLGGGKWKISGTVSQSDVPEGWMDVLPVYLWHSGGKVARLGFITVTQKESPFEITVPVKPEKVELNSYEDVLADIKHW